MSEPPSFSPSSSPSSSASASPSPSPSAGGYTIDYNPESNWVSPNQGSSSLINQKVAQSFTTQGETIKKAQVYMKGWGSPTGNVVAAIYEHSGTFGTSSKPTGTALATSDSLAASSITSTYALRTFTFSLPFQTIAGTHYILVIEHPESVSPNYLSIARTLNDTHAGNYAYQSTNWYTSSGDLVFYILGDYSSPSVSPSGSSSASPSASLSSSVSDSPSSSPSPSASVSESPSASPSPSLSPSASPSVFPDAPIVEITNIHLRIDKKIFSDRGNGTSSASGGVTVEFNKTFVDIISINVSANSTSVRIPVYDFDGSTPNPTSFDVYIYDDAGDLTETDFSWEATGL